MKFFQKYLSVWVILCIIIGVSIGHFFPMIPNTLNKFEYAGISISMAVLIWIMIYPMMIKVDFKSVKYISKNPKGLFVTWIVNWLIKPFTMYGIACLFFFVLFRAFIPVELATEYLAGAVLLGAAPCTAMVFVWSSLTQGNPVYTVVQVATNDIIILFAFGPIVKFLLGVSNVAVPFNTIFLSVVLFVVIPLVGGIITRMAVIRKHDENYLNQQFLNKFDSVTTIGLLLTLVLIFMFQSEVILKNPIHIILIAIPLIIQTFLIFGIAYVACYLLKLPHNIAAPAGMIGASNFFELAVAVAIALFGTTSEAALAIIDGTGPLSTDGTWGNHMQFTSKAIGELGAINGPRCCKRDAMIAFKNGIDYVNAHYGVTLQYEQMQCGFTDFNEQCIKERCPFHE